MQFNLDYNQIKELYQRAVENKLTEEDQKFLDELAIFLEKLLK